MKKSLLIIGFALIVITVMSLGVLNSNELKKDTAVAEISNNEVATAFTLEYNPDAPDFYYGVSTRFQPITKADLYKITSTNDIINNEHIDLVRSIKSTSVIIIKNHQESNIREDGTTPQLNSAQLELLRSSHFFRDIKLKVDFSMENQFTGQLEDNYASPHYTVVPVKQAQYANGKDVFMDFLKEKSKAHLGHVEKDNLRPAELQFTVTKEGTITKVKLTNTSGYPDVDQLMIELVKKTPGEWIPAQTESGEKVDQVFIYTFGLMGC